MTRPFAEIVHIPVDGLSLEGMLELPAGATGVVVFAHGSGSAGTAPGTTRSHSTFARPAWARC